MGREVHTEYMQPDDLLWARCVGEWGRRLPHYKMRVADHNSDWFANDQHGITGGNWRNWSARDGAQILERIEAILPDDDD